MPRWLSAVLVVVASVLAFAAVLAVWIDRQVLDTDNWATASSELLEIPAVRNRTAAYLADKAYEESDIEGQIASVLPPRLQPLAAPAAGFLRDRLEKRAREALARPEVQQLWEDANRTAHQRLLDALENEGPGHGRPAPPARGGRAPRRHRRARGRGRPGGRGDGDRHPLGAARLRAQGRPHPRRAPDRPRRALARAGRRRRLLVGGAPAARAPRVRDRVDRRRRARARRRRVRARRPGELARPHGRRGARRGGRVPHLQLAAGGGRRRHDLLRRRRGPRHLAGRPDRMGGRRAPDHRAVPAPARDRLRRARRARRPRLPLVGADAGDPQAGDGDRADRAAGARPGGAAPADGAGVPGGRPPPTRLGT